MESKPKSNILPTIEIILYTLLAIPFICGFLLFQGLLAIGMLHVGRIPVGLAIVLLLQSLAFLYTIVFLLSSPQKNARRILFSYTAMPRLFRL
ncbi:MAG: hypothetical protein FWG87_05955 [Defluviitaleaceae bacterium]|nr:hypothetical protein [Defluviitaleaceae bacterium]